jgi:predicted transcriptional regulator
MFNESVKILSLIDSGEQKSWDIAQKMDVPIKRFRAQIEKLLDLKFIKYEAHCFKYFLTTRGVNVLRCTNSEGNSSGETPNIIIGS